MAHRANFLSLASALPSGPAPSAVYDAVVVGAGPAGSATAAHLAAAGCRVLLLERSHFEQRRVGESLAPWIQPLLHSLGAWQRFSRMGALPSWGTRSLWGDDAPRTHSHLLSAYGCGWHVDRAAFDRLLAEHAADAGAELHLGSSPTGCQAASDGLWDLQLQQADAGRSEPPSAVPASCRARLLIDASGRSATLSRSLGARRLLFDKLLALATHWTDGDRGSGAASEPASEGFVLVESTEDGWWYSAPAPQADAHSSLVTMLFTDADLCGRADLNQAGRWRQRLDAACATCSRLQPGSTGAHWGPHAFSAVSQRLRRPDFHAAWLAVGDAALAVDPISGSGVVRALRQAEAAARSAQEWLQAATPGQRSEALRCHDELCDRECSQYLLERASYYAMEARWTGSAFWRRRRAMAAMASGDPGRGATRLGVA